MSCCPVTVAITCCALAILAVDPESAVPHPELLYQVGNRAPVDIRRRLAVATTHGAIPRRLIVLPSVSGGDEIVVGVRPASCDAGRADG